MSELFMECEEGELESWQRWIPKIKLVDHDDDDDEHSSKVTPNTRPGPAPVVKAVNQPQILPATTRSVMPVSPVMRAGVTAPTSPQRPPQATAGTQPVSCSSSGPIVPQLAVRATAQSVTKSLLIPVASQPGSLPTVAQPVSHALSTQSPQPIIINNQGYIVTSPQITNNSIIAYPPGTSFTVLPAGQQLLPQVTPAKAVPGVVSNAGIGTNAVKQESPPDTTISDTKRIKLELGASNVSDCTQNESKCPRCNIQFNLPDPKRNDVRMEKEYSSSWTGSEVQALLSVWSEDQIQLDLDSTIRNGKVFQTISRRLLEVGVHKTLKQCREKLKKLKQDYRRIKDRNSCSGSGRTRKTWRWYNSIDAVISRPANCGRCWPLGSAPAVLSSEATMGADVEEEQEHTQTEGSFLDKATPSTSSRTSTPMPEAAAPEITPKPPEHTQTEGSFLDKATPSTSSRSSTPMPEAPAPEITPKPPASNVFDCTQNGSKCRRCSIKSNLPVPKSGRKEKEKGWRVSEVQALLSVWSEDQIQLDLDSRNRNGKVFHEISRRLLEIGVHKSAKQCREKLKKLKQDYRRIKDRISRSGPSRKTWRWYASIDAVISHRPANCGRCWPLGSAPAVLLSEATMGADIEEEQEHTQTEGSFLDEATPSTSSRSSTPMPEAPAPGISPKPPGKRTRDQASELMAFLKETDQAHMEQDEKEHQQRERHFQLLMEDMVSARAEESAAREREAAIREREAAEFAAFNRGLLAVFRQLAKALGGQRAPEQED